MFTFLVVLISVLALLLILIILLQAGKGGGLAATFGGASSSTDSFIGGRQAASLLTRLTWIGGGLFLFLGLVLTILSSRSTETPQSILREQFGTTPDVPTSVLQSETDGGEAGEAQGDGAAADGPGETPEESAGDSEAGAGSDD